MNANKTMLLLAVLLISQGTIACSPVGPDPWFKTMPQLDSPALPAGVSVVDRGSKLYPPALKNDSQEPLYIVKENDRHWENYAEAYPNSEVPPEFIPVHKLVSGGAYFYDSYSKNAKGWRQNSGGFNNSAASQLEISIDLLNVEGGFQQVWADDRPQDTQIPSPQRFTILAFYNGRPIEITGTLVYSLNDDYDPKAREKGIGYCTHWNATAPIFGLIFIIILAIIPLSMIAVIAFILILRNKEKKEKTKEK